MTTGFLNINKPSGPTSHDIVSIVRRITGVRQVGHTGTLDPMASGVLVLAIGPATRLIQFLVSDKKWYTATIQLGVTTDTFDSQGKIVSQNVVPKNLSASQLDLLQIKFVGTVQQIPPVYSAIKVRGKRAYELARQGQQVNLQPRPVQIFSLKVNRVELPDIEIEIECSGGTYVRSLAHDIGQFIGCGGILTSLTRTANGWFSLVDSVELQAIQSKGSPARWRSAIIDTQSALRGVPCIELDDHDVQRVRHGNTVELALEPASAIIAYTKSGVLTAVLRPGTSHNLWQPDKVFEPAAPAESSVPIQNKDHDSF